MSEGVELRLTVGPEGEGVRVDRYLSEVLEAFPRSQIAHRDVHVAIGSKEVKLSRKLREGEDLFVSYSDPEPPNITAEPIELDIIFENDDVVVINKPAGMVVHPAAGNWSGTLVQGLMYHVATLSEEFGTATRPGIVHRLDKDTSGVIIAAKHPAALEFLSRQFKRHETQKHYLAVVRGQVPHSSGTIDASIARDPHNRKRFTVVGEGGKPAVTEYRVMRTYGSYAFLSLRPTTGRTHQLRVHLASLGCPILGDPIYGRTDRRFPDQPLALHAYQLTTQLPGEDDARTFTARVPGAFREALRAVSGRPSGT